MKDKINNNLIKMTYEDGSVHYFTSENRAAKSIGKQLYTIMKALTDGTCITFGDMKDRMCKVEYVDGTKVEYGQIN